MKTLIALIISGTLAISGYSQTRNVLVGTNNAVVQPTNFWSADASNARAGLGLGTAATNPASAFQSSSSVLSNLASSNAINLTNLQASNMVGAIAISNGGSGATTAGGARTNLGLGATWLTNTTASDFLSAVGLGSTNSAQFGGLAVGGNLAVVTNQIDFGSPVFFADRSGTNAVFLFEEASDAAIARTNLGLGWPALTNTNSGTGLVSVNTNGEVVSPTNFWQKAPITTTFIESQPTTNSSTNISPSRLLHIHSLATNIVNTTNTIVLPTNTLTFEGDVAIVVHKGPTNSMTRVQRAGSTNNLITLTRFDEAVQFVYYNDVWQFDHNIAFVEPIYFSGTNAGANAAASVTNLFTPNTPLVFSTNGQVVANTGTNSLTFTNANMVFQRSLTFQDDVSGNAFEASLGTNSTRFDSSGISFDGIAAATTRTNLGLGATNDVVFNNITANNNLVVSNSLTTYGYSEFNDGILINYGIDFGSTNIAATTRTNLGLGGSNIVTFAGLNNNGDITINQTATNNGLLYIYRTNAEPFLGLANLIASNNTTISNETLFRVGVSEATNKSAQFGFRSTNTNGNGVAVFSVYGYNALMMIGPSDPNAGTNPIQATISSINPTNKVMTLITTNTGAMQMHRPIEWDNTTNSAVTRTNLGLGATNSVTFSNVTASGTLTATSTVTAKTNLVVEGFVDYTAARTNNTPTNTPNFAAHAAWIEIKVGTNSFFLPAYQ